MRHAQFAPRPDCTGGDVIAHQLNAAAVDRSQATERLNQLGLAVAADAGNAQYFACAQLKTNAEDRRDTAGARHQKALHVEHSFFGLAGLLVYAQHDLAAHHQVGHVAHADVGDLARGNHAPAAHHADAVRHFLYFKQLVRDQHDGAAIGGQIAYDVVELTYFLRGEHGGRFIKHEDARVALQGLQDFNALLHADRNVGDDLQRIDRQAIVLRQVADRLGLLRRVDETQLPWLDAEHDVLGNGEGRDQLEVLMHHANPGADGIVGVVDLYLLAIHLDFTTVCAHQAVEDVHERGLAGAVLALQGRGLRLRAQQSPPRPRPARPKWESTCACCACRRRASDSQQAHRLGRGNLGRLSRFRMVTC